MLGHQFLNASGRLFRKDHLPFVKLFNETRSHLAVKREKKIPTEKNDENKEKEPALTLEPFSGIFHMENSRPRSLPITSKQAHTFPYEREAWKTSEAASYYVIGLRARHLNREGLAGRAPRRSYWCPQGVAPPERKAGVCEII